MKRKSTKKISTRNKAYMKGRKYILKYGWITNSQEDKIIFQSTIILIPALISEHKMNKINK